MQPDVELERRARRLVGELSEEGRLETGDLRRDVAAIDLVLEEQRRTSALDSYLVCSLEVLKGQCQAAMGLEREGLQAWTTAIATSDGSQDRRARHQGDLARMYLAEWLVAEPRGLAARRRKARGLDYARALLVSFDRCDDEFLEFKARMLMDLAHVLLATDEAELVVQICASVAAKCQDDTITSRSLAAEAAFYAIQADSRLRKSAGVEGQCTALLRAGEPGLDALGRIGQRFSESEGNAPWILQVDSWRVLILQALGRADHASILWQRVIQRAELLGVPRDALPRGDMDK